MAQFGHEADTVAQEGPAGGRDSIIWEGAQRTGRFLVTQDMDFSGIRRFAPGAHKGILLVRLREPGRTALINRIHAVFRTEPVEEWSGCFVVATERKIRVRRPS